MKLAEVVAIVEIVWGIVTLLDPSAPAEKRNKRCSVLAWAAAGLSQASRGWLRHWVATHRSTFVQTDARERTVAGLLAPIAR